MLLIETYIKEVRFKGLGLFAKNFIPKGTVWWTRNEEFDLIISPQVFNNHNTLQQVFIQTYGSLEPTGNWYVCTDESRFVNHSERMQSESCFDENGLLLSCSFKIDIFPDEEIIYDYRECCCASKQNLGFISFD